MGEAPVIIPTFEEVTMHIKIVEENRKLRREMGILGMTRAIRISIINFSRYGLVWALLGCKQPAAKHFNTFGV